MAEAHTIKTQVICGFLGAGKTTFILEQVKRIGARTAVLVNEFGSLGIDGETIKARGGIDVVEMPGGCICCSQQQGLITSIIDIAYHLQPDILLIEPSGVAESSELLKVLNDSSLDGIVDLDAVVTIIDATTFLEFSEPDAFGTFFLDQVEYADIVLVSKIDLVGAAELQSVTERVRAINEQAAVVTTVYGRVDKLPSPGRRSRNWGISRRTDLGLTSCSVIPNRALSHDGLERFLTKLYEGQFGEVLRAKGFLRIENYGCVSIQVTSTQLSVELIGRDVAPRLALIGVCLDSDSITRCLNLANL